jgi:hypothetical protein
MKPGTGPGHQMPAHPAPADKEDSICALPLEPAGGGTWNRCSPPRAPGDLAAVSGQLCTPKALTLLVRRTGYPPLDITSAYRLRDVIPGARSLVEADGAPLYFPEERPRTSSPPAPSLGPLTSPAVSHSGAAHRGGRSGTAPSYRATTATCRGPSWRPDNPRYVSALCVWLRAGPPFSGGAVVARHAGVDREAGWRRLLSGPMAWARVSPSSRAGACRGCTLPRCA